MSTEEPFCGRTLLAIGTNYKKNISGYIDIPICIIGLVFNSLNLLMFTRKTTSSPINLIFANLTFVDLLTLIALIPSSWLHITDITVDDEDRSSHQRAVFSIVSHDFIATFHFISTFLTVTLAIWRYIAVVHPFTGWHRCNMKTTRNVVSAIYIMCILLSMPMYLSREVVSNHNNNQTTTYGPAFKEKSTLLTISFVIRGILQYLLPSVLLPIFSFKLIAVVLARKGPQEQPTPSSYVQNDIRSIKLKQQNDRSIITLLILIAFFFITKVPCGMLYLMFTVYGRLNNSHNGCFFGLKAIFTTLTAIDMSITFVLYYTMSQNFRIAFKSLLDKNDISFQKWNIFALSNTKKTVTGPETRA